MKNTLTFILIIISPLLLAQQKGVVAVNSGDTQEGVVRAVVIGISDYKDPAIPDLKYAHKDAEAFVQYLQSEAGGAIPEEHIRLLTNEQATIGQLYAVLDWLIEKSQEGDRAIIYFSGHGDVETKTRSQAGFLLPHDSPPQNYRSGAFALYFLQDVIETISLDKKAQVIMISDACRSGKLAGAESNGPRSTTAALAQQFASEIKILSCQPEEFSLEGEQWGGGRGCFSYHLIDGLYGLADKNKDKKINLLELEGYLEDKVPTEAAPQSQIPMTLGSKATLIANVEEKSLESFLASKESQTMQFSHTSGKGIENKIISSSSEHIQQTYQAFEEALERGDLISPRGKSANDHYKTLSQESALQDMHSFIKRRFVAALLDETQWRRNKLLTSDPQEFADANEINGLYDHLPAHMEKAAELLGKDHYMYSTIKAWEYDTYGFIVAISICQCQEKEFRNKSMRTAIEYLKKSEKLQGQNSLTSGGLYFAYKGIDNLDSALFYAKQMVKTTPNFSLGYTNAASVYATMFQPRLAVNWYKKGIENADMTYVNMYGIGSMYGELAFRKYYKRMHNWKYRSYSYSSKMPKFKKKKFDKAFVWLDHSIQEFPCASSFNLAGKYYILSGEHNRGEEMLRKSIQLQPLFSPPYTHLTTHYIKQQEDQKLQDLMLKMEKEPFPRPDLDIYKTIAVGYLYLRDYEKFDFYYKKAIRTFVPSIQFHYKVARLMAIQNKKEEALYYLNKALNQGFDDRKDLNRSPDLDNLRGEPEFIELMKKYRKHLKLTCKDCFWKNLGSANN